MRSTIQGLRYLQKTSNEPRQVCEHCWGVAMPTPRHRNIPAGSIDLHGRTVGASNAPSMSDVSAAPDVQAIAGRGHLYVGGARVAENGCGPRGESPGERVQAVVQVETDDVVDVAQDEARTGANRRSGGVLVAAPRPRVRAGRCHAGRRQRDFRGGASDPPVAGRQFRGERVLLRRAMERYAAARGARPRMRPGSKGHVAPTPVAYSVGSHHGSIAAAGV